MAGLENNKCEACDGTGSNADNRANCETCKGTGKKVKAALAVNPREEGANSKDPESPRYRPSPVDVVKEVTATCPTCLYFGVVLKPEKLFNSKDSEYEFECQNCFQRFNVKEEEITPRFNLGNLNHLDRSELTLAAYSSESRKNALYPNRGTSFGLAYAGLGLAGESGEVADKIKKVLRDHGGELNAEQRQAILLELGDSLWYVDAVAFECGLTLEEVAAANLKKLVDRRERKVIHGEGDNR